MLYENMFIESYVYHRKQGKLLQISWLSLYKKRTSAYQKLIASPPVSYGITTEISRTFNKFR